MLISASRGRVGPILRVFCGKIEMQNAAKSYQNAYRLFYAFLKFSKKIIFFSQTADKMGSLP